MPSGISLLVVVVAALLGSCGCHAQQQYTTLSLLSPTFPYLSSIAIDSTDYLYVLNGTTLVEYNTPRTAVWSIDLSFVLRRPVAIKVDSTGQIYITERDRREHAVVVFDSEGDMLAVYDGMKGAASDGQPLSPAGLAFDRAGMLYVVDQAHSRVVVFDRNGNVTAYLTVPDGGARQLLMDVVVDVWNTVYVSDVGNGRVVVLEQQNNTMVAQWFGGFVSPVGLAIDPSNRVYVADSSSNTTFVFNTAGQQLWQQAWQAYRLSPHWLAVDSTGQLFVADVVHNTVGIISGLVLPGTILSVLSGQVQPVALAVSNTSLLLVVNSLPSNIEAVQMYAYNYDYYVYQLTSVNASQPAGLAVSNAGNFACQSDGLVVNCYTVNGYYSGRRVLTLQPTNIPGAIAIDDVQLLIYVVNCQAEYHSWTIQVFNFAGQMVKQLDYGLTNPLALAVSPVNANLYIADGSRVVVANRQGTQLHSFSVFQHVAAVAVDSSNNIYGYDWQTGQLVVLDEKGNELYSIEHGFNGARSVAVDKLGRIILADTNNNRVVVMQGLNMPPQQRERHATKDAQTVEEQEACNEDQGRSTQ